MTHMKKHSDTMPDSLKSIYETINKLSIRKSFFVPGEVYCVSTDWRLEMNKAGSNDYKTVLIPRYSPFMFLGYDNGVMRFLYGDTLCWFEEDIILTDLQTGSYSTFKLK